MERGISGTLDTLSLTGPILWASLATGQPPDQHGVSSEYEVRPDRGGIQAVGAQSWHASPVWEVLHVAGIPTAVVGWPATAPAESWPGCVVDHHFPVPVGPATQDWPLPPRCIAPRRLRDSMRTLRVHPDELAGESCGGLPPRAVAAAASIQAAALQIAECEEWRFLAVHYDLSAADRNDTGYRFLDAILGRLMAAAGPEADIFVASAQGLLIAVGPGFPQDMLVHGATLYGIAPSILARFGLPRDAVPRRHAQPAVTGEAPPPGPAAVRLIEEVEHERLLRLAGSVLVAGDHAAAADLLEPAVKLRPGDQRTRFLLGQCRFFLGDWKACLAHGESLAETAPDSPWGAMIVGAAMALSGDRDGATLYLRQATGLAGRDAAAHVRLGAIALHLGWSAEAASHYRAALAIDRGSAEARAGVALALLAEGNATEAEAELRASLALRFHAPALHHQLALLLAAQGRRSAAIESLRTALAQFPGYKEVAALLHRLEASGLQDDAPERKMAPD